MFVDEVTPGGPADRQGIQKGDVLTQCSAVVLKAGKEGAYEENGYGEVVYDNWKVSVCSRRESLRAQLGAALQYLSCHTMQPTSHIRAAAKANLLGHCGQAAPHCLVPVQVVMFDCSGQPFKSVMSALKSNNPRCG